MAKGIKKKKNRKLRKQIRKTVGALFMISAIVIAAIPVQNISANPTDTTPVKVAVVHSGSEEPIKSATVKYDSSVPIANDRTDPQEKIVYTSGDGTFQFVYLRRTTSDTNKVAMLLGYNAGVLAESSLTIPETLEAYRQYTDNVSSSGYCLVSKNDNFLYYEDKAQKKDPTVQDGLLWQVPAITIEVEGIKKPLEVNQFNPNLKNNTDGSKYYEIEELVKDPETGEEVMKPVRYEAVAIMEKVIYPCYYEQKSAWEKFKDSELYYLRIGGNAAKVEDFLPAGDDNNYWKINADVAYIGNEKIKAKEGNTGWELDGFITNPEDGVFARQNNITNLTVGENILAIGDYAFYGCATLQSVSLANGLRDIGNGAFGECINLQSCNIASNANISAIGKDAFYNCRSLTDFTTPIGLRALGDNCFEGCTGLTSVNLTSGNAMALNRLGNFLFKDCSSLTAVEFPVDYTENDLSINMFDGCSSLQYVKIPNQNINFVETAEEETNETGFAEFKKTVPSSFYFEGPAVSKIHDTATKYEIAFKYLGEEIYEVILSEKAVSGTTPDPAKVTYQVNNLNELIKVEITGSPENITIPASIGPYGISSIGKGSFNNNCTLSRITIPASVTAIGEEAFQGCHAMKTVIFSDATTIQSIGNNAFKTQKTGPGCSHSLGGSGGSATPAPGGTGTGDPSLTFVGAMYNPATGQDTVSFIFAMNGESYINNDNQQRTYITCHSGWPTNIEVQYKYDPVKQTGEAELQKYPKYSELKNTPANWLETLPYVTTENKSDYLTMVEEAVTKYEAYVPGSTEQPTENEMAIVNSALNIVLPNSIDRIKPGIFSGVDSEGNAVSEKNGGYQNKQLQSIVLNGVNEIEPYTFQNCIALKDVSVIGPALVNDYSFEDCTALENVTLGANVADTGKRPFKGCTKLTGINCLGSNFSYKDGILYRTAEGGMEIIECLEGRGNTLGSYTVGPEELTGVTKIREEAFEDCTGIGKVDLSAAAIEVVPKRCFANTEEITAVILPNTTGSIEAEAFQKSGIRVLTIPSSVTYIEKEAFRNKDKFPNAADQTKITFECVEGSAADRYAKSSENPYINPEYGKVFLSHWVYFWDDLLDEANPVMLVKQSVKDGEDAVPPPPPVHDGYNFVSWSNYKNISRDTDVYARYSLIGETTYTVRFIDWDDNVLDTQEVAEGQGAKTPPAPSREGYIFTGWRQPYDKIMADTDVYANYEKVDSSENMHTVTFYNYDNTVVAVQPVKDGAGTFAPQNPTRSGYTFVGWFPTTYLSNVKKDLDIIAVFEKNTGSGENGNGSEKPKGSASPSPTASASPSASPKTYTVSVSGGSGSGSYAAGAIVTLNAYAMSAGQTFDKWTTSTAGVGFADPSATSTTFTMPAANVAITATYKTGGGTTSSTGGAGQAGGSGTTGTGTGSTGTTGTTVDVNRPGISNTNLAGATVTGATDNFVVKITEDEAATAAAVAALQAKYGDISRIKYLPMDISLYDSTGRTKIADTSGISVNVTLPLPDDLVEYAGNNRMASAAGNTIEDLNTRFTTVGGVPCINFTATHFSPYVIYVDTANLTEATIDATPKTGDPIHPKWFLATGLACIALILFFKRDKAVIPVKTA